MNNPNNNTNNNISCELAYQTLTRMEEVSDRKLLVITNGVGQSHELLKQLSFFLGDKAAKRQEDILLIPDTQVLAYDSFSPDPHTTSKRIRAFYKLLSKDYQVAIIAIGTLLRLTPPPAYFIGQGLNIRRGQQLDRENFIRNLIDSGYSKYNYVAQPGDMAVRGAIIDVFPAAADYPYRIEWLDDTIESLRSFNVKDQTSIEQLDEIRILPPTEFPVHEEGLERFTNAWQAHFSGAARRHPVYYEIKQGKISAGIESFLPLFFDRQLTSFFDYMSSPSTADSDNNRLGLLDSVDLLHPPLIIEKAKLLLEEARNRWQELGGDEAILMPPESLFLDETKLSAYLDGKANIYVPYKAWKPNAYKKSNSSKKSLVVSKENLIDVSIDVGHTDKSKRLDKFSKFIADYNKKILLCLSSVKRYELLKDWLAAANISYQETASWDEFVKNAANEKVHIINVSINHGMIAADWAILCEYDLFGNSVIDKGNEKGNDKGDNKESDTKYHYVGNDANLQHADRGTFTPGELVVHKDYGVGRFLTLENRSYGDYSGDFIVIEYAESTKLYLPVHNLHFLSSFSSLPGAEHPLDKLGGKQWGNRRLSALAKIEDTAASLLNIYAERESQIGIVFNEPDKDYEEFSLGFPFEETPGQRRAIAEVLEDMVSSKKADRLICGDVGFGKTEVAMRAAYVALASGYQVAVLTPTTVLASQHLHSFRDRFAATPFVIEGLSRLSDGHTGIVTKLADAKIDIVIGTHALLGKSIKFAKLGLVIIDEEHRFGVKQKEKLKALHKQVDIISLSATPIPRTLNLALSGLRDISLLANPPPGRLPIKTYTGNYDDSIVKEAVQRELMRDGQIYYVFNHLDHIDSKCEYLQKMFPTATIAAVHGRVDKHKLEDILRDFYHKEISILVCSTIIENGLDAPNANTIIIDEPELLGLSQLHQLRGRVGRRKRQAFAYLLTSYVGSANKPAAKRIQAIRDNADLGSGFNLASRDLEIRGAGEILGSEQSGFMQKLGLELYTKMLNEAVASLSAAKSGSTEITPITNCEMDLSLSAFIPDDYIEDLMERVRIYKQLAAADLAIMEGIKRQLIDRYGPLPVYANHLFESYKLKFDAQQLGITEIKIARSRGYAVIDKKHNRSLAASAEIVRRHPAQYAMAADTLHFRCGEVSGAEKLLVVSNLLKLISDAG